MLLKCVCASSLMVLVAAGAHAQEHRQLGAHEHGHGTLNIAIEGTAVTMDLEAPGDDIVGFEHEAVTPNDKAAVEAASVTLAKALEIFKMPSGAGCKVKDAKVSLQAEKHDEEETYVNNSKAGSATQQHDHEEEHEGHKEFHVTYELECAAPANLTTIDFDYFKNFSRSQKLTVNLIASKGQSSFEVTPERPRLDLTGLI